VGSAALLAAVLVAQAPPSMEPALALRQAVAAAEASLRSGDAAEAERRSRTALLEGWLLRGRVAAAEGRATEARDAFKAAAQELDAAPAGEARDLELAFALASEHLALDDVESAAALFARIAAQRPIAPTHVLIGRAYRDFGRFGRARAELQAALQKDAGARRAHYYLGTVAVKEKGLGGLDEAIEHFGAELEIAPGDPLASLELGVALVESQRPAEALPALETAARAGPASPRTLAYLGRAQLRLDRPAEAAATLARALALARQQGANAAALLPIHLQLGQALARLGRADEAALHFAESQRLSAQGTTTEREELARYLADSADPEGAKPASPSLAETAALKRLPPDRRQALEREAAAALARTYLNLGVLHAQAERFARAAELFEKAAALDPTLPQVQQSLGVAYFNARAFDKATGPLERALAARPEDATLKRMLGLAWINLQEYRKAAALLADDPERESNPSLQFAYGLALVKSERAAEAEAVFSRLLARHGDSPEVSVMLGQAHAQQGDFEAAVQSLRRALELKEDVAEANATLGVIYLKQGRLEEAEAALRAELRSHPADLLARQHLAVVLDSLQRPEEALPLLRELLKAKPDQADARYLLGKILLAQGAAADAAAELEAAVRLAPADPGIHYQLGRAYQALGRTTEAERQFEVFRQLKAER
jgi:tetratricopeptide (TPR) repeat protein